MKDPREALSEDLRRYGLVLLGAGVLADVSPTFRILGFAAGLTFMLSAYIILAVLGGSDDDHRT